MCARRFFMGQADMEMRRFAPMKKLSFKDYLRNDLLGVLIIIGFLLIAIWVVWDNDRRQEEIKTVMEEWK